jgi:hypothetical protein
MLGRQHIPNNLTDWNGIPSETYSNTIKLQVNNIPTAHNNHKDQLCLIVIGWYIEHIRYWEPSVRIPRMKNHVGRPQITMLRIYDPS